MSLPSLFLQQRQLSRGGGTVSTSELSETVNGPTVIEGTDLAIDSAGFPYNAKDGDPTADHSQTEARGDSWAYAKNSAGYYVLTLNYSFDGDLTGVEFNCRIVAYCNLSGGVFNQLVQLQNVAHATGCTFNASVFLNGQQTTVENCTLNLGLTNYCPDGRIINCDSTNERYGVLTDVLSGGSSKLTITNSESNTFVNNIFAHNGSSLVLNSGNFTGIQIDGSGSLDINGGTYSSSIWANDTSTLTVNDGTFNGTCVATKNSTVILNDGVFKANVGTNDSSSTMIINNGQFDANVIAPLGEITIKDGVFKGRVVAGRSSETNEITGTLNITGGVFAYKPVNTDSEVYKIAADDATFNGLASPIYVANQTATPRITMNYSGSTGHQIIAWRIDIDNAAKNHVHTDGTNTLSQLLLKVANYQHSDDLHTISLDCVRSVYNQNAFTADIALTPVIDLLPSELTFNAPTEDTQASVTLGEGMPETIEIVSSYKNVETGETTTTYPTKPGTYQISVNLNSTNPPAEEDVTAKYAHRPFWNGAYHQLPYTGQEALTSTSWQFTVEPQAPSIDPDTGVPTNPDSAGSDWSYTPGEDGEKGTLEVKSDGKLDLSDQDAAVKCDVKSDGEIAGGTFEGSVETTEASTISGGTYSGEVTGSGTITGGTFTGTIGDDVKVEGGVFTEKAAENLDVTKASVTVTGGASINRTITSEEGEDATAYVVTENKDQKVTLSYTPAEVGREFYGWQSTVAGQESALSESDSGSTSVTIKQGEETAVTYTPVVKMNDSDLTITGDQIEVGLRNVTVESAPMYYLIENGEPVASTASEFAPTEPGTYGKFVALSVGQASENSIALFAAADPTRVVEKDGLGYYVPELLLLGDTMTIDPEIPDDTPSDGSDAGAGAAIAVGAVAAGGAAYLIGTQVYLTSVLPEGTAIPTNKAALAAVLWNAAGKPEPQSTALFADIAADASETQKAARWCVEQGLLNASGDKFTPNGYTFRPQVIKAWNQLQTILNAE